MRATGAYTTAPVKTCRRTAGAKSGCPTLRFPVDFGRGFLMARNSFPLLGHRNSASNCNLRNRRTSDNSSALTVACDLIFCRKPVDCWCTDQQLHRVQHYAFIDTCNQALVFDGSQSSCAAFACSEGQICWQPMASPRLTGLGNTPFVLFCLSARSFHGE